ncbi:Crp/Fnr family transcriptional regulator [Gammaproteobacteria bacterium]
MTPTKKKLLRLFDGLEDSQQEMLLAFTEFLYSRANKQRAIPNTPLPIPRPPTESAIGAIKRLSATYPMLDQARLFNETSILMTAHLMEGRPLSEVINELEVLFERNFKQWRSEQAEESSGP